MPFFLNLSRTRYVCLELPQPFAIIGTAFGLSLAGEKRKRDPWSLMSLHNTEGTTPETRPLVTVDSKCILSSVYHESSILLFTTKIRVCVCVCACVPLLNGFHLKNFCYSSYGQKLMLLLILICI